MTGAWHDPTRHDWDRQPERGSAGLVRLMIWLSLTLGWRVGHLLLYPITAYFFLWSRGARTNSRVYLSRALGRPAGSRDIFRQYFAFAAVIFDRIFLLTDRIAGYDVRLVGLDHLTAHLAHGGCLLFGAHIGSFEILRAVAPRDRSLTIKALMHRNGVTPLTGPLERLNPALRADTIEIGSLDAMLQIRESLAAGAVIGVLGDRAPEHAGPRAAERRAEVPFFGEPAIFPTGPMAMAAALGAPVVLFFGVWTGPRRYEIHFEPFADRVTFGPDRQSDLRDWVARYAARLEARCRAHPYNWFNLYNFWGHETDGAPPAARRPSPPGDAGDCRELHGHGSHAVARVGAGEPFDLPGGTNRRPVDHAGA